MIGKKITILKELWPINRSITGQGLRETLKRISNFLPKLEIKSIPSVAKCLIGMFQKNGM